MEKRLTNLLSLLSQENYQTAEQLAKKMSLSTKTLRKLVGELDSILLNNGAHIDVKWGQGYRLKVDSFAQFQRIFEPQEEFSLISSEERVSYILEYFLTTSDYIKAEALSDMLYVCKKTLAGDLKKAEQILNSYHIEIIRKPYYGMKISGSEFNIRLCLAKCREMRGTSPSAHKDAEQAETKAIYECVLACLEKEGCRLSDLALRNLIIHTRIALARIRKGKSIELPASAYRDLIGAKEMAAATACAEELEKLFAVKMPESEVAYLAIHIAGKEYGAGLHETEANVVISEKIQNLVAEMLDEIYQVFLIDFRGDLELNMILGCHLLPLDIRMQFGLKLVNPMLDEIKSKYSMAYIMSMQACSVLERYYHKLVDANEIAYIALLFALKMERQRTQKQKKNILFVCSSGAATARLLAYRIQETFSDCVGKVITCDEHSVSKQDFSGIDYIFTTVPIRSPVPVPICETKFSLTEKDIRSTRRVLENSKVADVLPCYPQSLFIPHLDAKQKDEALAKICKKIEEEYPLPQGFLQAVKKREKLAQTCMGNMVAMPHPCQVMTDKTFVSVAILETPIQWSSEAQVQAIFLVSISKNNKEKIQSFYSVTARLLLNKEYMEELIQTRSYQTLTNLLEKVAEELEEH